MDKIKSAVIIALLVGGLSSAWADDSGHVGVNSLKSQMRQMHRSHAMMATDPGWTRCRRYNGVMHGSHRCL